jgi:amino acid adenylation domain-containing protein
MNNLDIDLALQQNHKANLITIFLSIVNKYPDKTAIIETSSDKRTYRDLDIYSDQIANAIYKIGLPSNRRIGICIARSYDTIATAVAVMKLGCTYIPLAHDFPVNRLHDICKKAELEFIIANDNILDKLPIVDIVVNIDKEKTIIKRSNGSKFIADETQNQPVNIIFTSGTVSTPKGVIISQSSLINLVKNQNYAKITNNDVFLQISPFEFDGATLEIWGTLLNGATLILMPPGYPVLSIIAEKIKTYKISLLFITTQLFNLMVDNRLEELDMIKTILTGGEKASVKHMRKFLENRRFNHSLSNIYGPAECTTFSTYYPIASLEQIAEMDNIPIGKEIHEAYKIVVDENLMAVPKNTIGELLIGGKGVSSGYLDAPALTQEKFIHKEYPGISSKYFYRTGDKVFENNNGDIVFLGRYDKQLKIRGYRIFPEEIELVAMRHPDIAGAALLVSENEIADKYTELFVTSNNNLFSETEIKNFLKKELPGYIHVNRVTHLKEIPLKQNGKIDYDQLKQSVLER